MSELLAPAGGREALIAAVQNGADAVYLGARLFNARRGADNFDEGGLQEAVSYCHARGVRVHVTLNTLVRDGEMAALEEQVREVAEAGADAGDRAGPGRGPRLVRQMAPGLSLHASTQMAVHDRQGVEYCATMALTARCWRGRCRLPRSNNAPGWAWNWKPSATGRCACVAPGQCLFSSLVAGAAATAACARSPAVCRTASAMRAAICSPRATSCCWMNERPWSGPGVLFLQDRGAVEAARVRGRGHVRLPPRPRRQAHHRHRPRGAFADLQPRRFQPWLPARYERRGADVSRAAQPHGRAGGDRRRFAARRGRGGRAGGAPGR